MSKKEFLSDLKNFLELINQLNFTKTDNTNFIYSFGGSKITDVLNLRIRRQLNELIEAFKKNDSNLIQTHVNNLHESFQSSFLSGEISNKQLDRINLSLDNLVEKYKKAIK